MQTVIINNQKLKATKTEAAFVADCKRFLNFGGADAKRLAQVHIDIILRSSPNAAAKERRQAIARALGLSDQIAYL